MLTTGDFENLEVEEIRKFNYNKLVDELGPMENYKKYHGFECEPVTRIEEIDGVKIIDKGWEIIGTNKIIEEQWTDLK